MTALQVLPPRQLAVLILRDVLGFHASEVAGMLDSTVESVTSALKRARATLERRRQAADGREPPPAPGSPAEDAIVARFTSAYESADLDALVALLTDDVFMSMPPIPFEYEGRDLVASFCASLFAAGRKVDLVPTRANGQPAFGAYVSAPVRRPASDRPHHHHHRGRPDLRDEPFREQRAPLVRAAAFAPEPLAFAGFEIPLEGLFLGFARFAVPEAPACVGRLPVPEAFGAGGNDTIEMRISGRDGITAASHETI